MHCGSSLTIGISPVGKGTWQAARDTATVEGEGFAVSSGDDCVDVSQEFWSGIFTYIHPRRGTSPPAEKEMDRIRSW